MTTCTNCGHHDTPPAAPTPATPADGFQPGENWAQRMARLSRSVRDWIREEEQIPLYFTVGHDTIKLQGRRGTRGQIIRVEVLHEVDRHGMPMPDRVWHRYPDGTMSPRFAEDATARHPNVEHLGHIPTAAQARREAMSTAELQASRPTIEPISRDPGDFTSKYVFAPMPGAR